LLLKGLKRWWRHTSGGEIAGVRVVLTWIKKAEADPFKNNLFQSRTEAAMIRLVAIALL
jgi:hypothetical protein